MGYIETVESFGWQLHDTTELPPGDNWDVFNRQAPATTVETGHEYVFTRQPGEGQTVLEAYKEVGGVGPCLQMGDPNSPDYLAVELYYTPKIALFSRMLVKSAGVILTIPRGGPVRLCDLLILAPDTAEATFTRDFRITTLQEVMRLTAEHNRGIQN